MKRLSRTVERALMFAGTGRPLDTGSRTAAGLLDSYSSGCSTACLSDFSRAFLLPAARFLGGFYVAPLRCYSVAQEVLP